MSQVVLYRSVSLVNSSSKCLPMTSQTRNSNTTTKHFANDIKLYTDINIVSSTNDLQYQLNGILNGSREWQLPISFSKCIIFFIDNGNFQHQYCFQIKIISRSDVVRDLGIIVDPNHIHGIVSRAHIHASQCIWCFLFRKLMYNWPVFSDTILQEPFVNWTLININFHDCIVYVNVFDNSKFSK